MAKEEGPPDDAQDIGGGDDEQDPAVSRVMGSEAALRSGDGQRHRLTHLPMNSCCDVCQTAKLRQKPARRRRGDVELRGRQSSICGYTLFADHVSVSTRDLGLSVDDDKYGLAMLDVGSDVCGILAATPKNTQCTLAAIKEFGSVNTWQFFGSDNAKEVKAASATTQMVHPAPEGPCSQIRRSMYSQIRRNTPLYTLIQRRVARSGAAMQPDPAQHLPCVP